MRDIKPVKAQVEKLANWADAEVRGNRLWRSQDFTRRLLENTQPWENPTFKGWIKTIKEYIKDTSSISPRRFFKARFPGENIEINEKEIPYFKPKEINENLPEEYFYHCGPSIYGKPVFFLGEIEEQKKINEINEVIIGSELVGNCLLLSTAFFDFSSNSIVGRRKSSERKVWTEILNLKKGGKKLEDYIPSKGFKLLGLGEEDIKKEGKEIAEKGEEISKKYLNASFKHEEGHYQLNKNFPYKAFNSVK